MANNLIQPKGSVSKETNKQSIARITGVKAEDVEYIIVGLDLDGLKYLYEESTETVWTLTGSEIGIVQSWSISSDIMTIITDQETYDLLKNIQNNSNIKYVKSFEELKNTKPKNTNELIQTISYYENGNSGSTLYCSKRGTAIDDNGHICVPNNQTEYYWEAVTNTVELTSYGVKTFSWNANNVTIQNDQSDRVNSACARSVLTGLPLIAPPASENNSLRGIPVLKTIDITNVREIVGDLLLFAHNLRGTYTNDLGTTTQTGVSQPFVLINMNGNFGSNGGYVFSSVKGPRTYDTIRVVNLGDLSTRLNGQLHFFASTIFKRCFSDGFNGWGIRWGIIQDSLINHQSSSKCGNINQYAIHAYGYPVATGSSSDFCNNLTFESIICEYSQDRSFFIAGPAIRYDRIHEEGTICTNNVPDSWGVHSIDTYASQYGSKIANVGLSLNNGSGGQLNIIDLNNNSTASMNVVLNMSHTTYEMVHATRSGNNAATIPTNVILATGWAGDGGTVDDIHADQVYLNSTQTNVNNIACTTLEIKGLNSLVEKASAKYLNLVYGTLKCYTGSSTGYANIGGGFYPANLHDSVLLNENIYLDTTSSQDSVISSCYFGGKITRGRYDGTTLTVAGTRPVIFNNCYFSSNLELPSAGALIEFNGCTFNNLVIGSGTYYQIHNGSRIITCTKDSAAWGLWAFDSSTTMKTFSGTWAWPNTAYDNLNMLVCNPLNGRSRRYISSGWMQKDGPYGQQTINLLCTKTNTVTSDISLPGVVVGDNISITFFGDTIGVVLSAVVISPDVIRLYAYNNTANDITLNGIFKYKVL